MNIRSHFGSSRGGRAARGAHRASLGARMAASGAALPASAMVREVLGSRVEA